MCGIVGTVNKPFDKDILKTIAHRGPDDSGIVNFKSSNSNVTFGHVRLSIQDLSAAGHQPMYSACGNLVIIFNGEIYNHLELRQKLDGIEWRGHSDTETILNYIARYGLESVKDFNGIFAFAILNIEKQKLYLARDRYGVKPIYYHKNKDIFIFSSEVKPILKLTKYFDVDNDALNEYLIMRFNSASKTMFKDIFKLMPGEIIEYNLNTNTVNSLHNINKEYLQSINIDNKKNEKYWIDKVSDYLEEAVKRQMLSDVEIGSFLSGGLDSALITKIASKYSKSKIKTFCVGFKDVEDEDDEIDEAKRSSVILNTEHRDVILDPNDYYDKYLKDSIYMLEEPNGSAPTFAQYEVSKLASNYVKVALAGQGADEIFYGYPKYYAEIQRNKYLIPINILKSITYLTKLFKNDKLKRFIYAMSEKDELLRYIKTREVFSKQEKAKLFKVDGSYSIESFDFYFKNIGKDILSVDKFALVDTYTQLSDELLVYGDKMTMATSLEMRVPFLDNELVKLVNRIPYEYKVRSNNQKYILKKVAEKYLPDEIINRKKKGFVMPILKWFQKDLQEKLISDLVEKNAFVHKYMNKDSIYDLIISYKIKEETDYRKLLLVLHFNKFGEVYENYN